MFKRIGLVALAGVFLLTGWAVDVRSQTAKKAVVSSKVVPTAKIGEFHKPAVGEKLSYTVKLNNVGAAKLTLETVDRGEFFGREGFQFKTKVETVGLIRKTVIEVNDVFMTFLDAKSRLAYRAEREIKEGPKRESGMMLFDQDKLKAEIDGGTPVTLKKPTFDLPGLLWAIRNLDLNGVKVQRLHGLDKSGKIIVVDVEKLGLESVALEGKDVDAVKLAVRAQGRDGKVSDDLQVRMWIENSPRRRPVLMTATAPFGELRVELLSPSVKKEEG